MPACSTLGWFECIAYRNTAAGRSTSTTFRMHCNGIAFNERELLLLSVIGPETSAKSVSAALRSSERDQERIEYHVNTGTVQPSYVSKSPTGYHVHRAKLGYGLWHILLVSRRPGFLPVLSDDALWQHLRSDEFTTPLLREWVPWLRSELCRRGNLIRPTQGGCETALVNADSELLDELVTHGLRTKRLWLPDEAPRPKGARRTSRPRSLDDYLTRFGPFLAQQAEQALTPLHRPDRESIPKLSLSRRPFDPQAHVIVAANKALARQKAILIVGEMGTGKTLMGMATVHVHSNGRPYRSLVFCPGQLVQKWEREIRETIPDAEVIQIENWKQLVALDRKTRPSSPQWFIIARDRAKLGSLWRPACLVRNQLDAGFLRCPECGRRLVNDKREPIILGEPAKDGRVGTGLWKKRARCEWVLHDSAADGGCESPLIEGCGSPLWQMTGEIRRYEPALFIKRHLRHFFNYLLADELHETKGADTAQGHAIASLAASCRKIIGMTGTLIGGYAEHLRPILFRLSPRSLVNEGLGWSDATAFSERYGRIETRITEKSKARSEGDNRMSRGSKSTIKFVRPGIMPPLFGRHLIDKCVFLGLSEVASNLPSFTEECLSVRMDSELSDAYRHRVERPLRDAISQLLKRHDRRLLGTMLQALLAYPDFPFEWQPLGYADQGRFIEVTQPPTLDTKVIRPKEQALIDLARSERTAGRKVWVFVQFTDTHDVQSRLHRLLDAAGLRVGTLRSSVPLARREEWILKHSHELDVVISHPRLVETGLDLFDKAGRHNFPTLIFYETGYNLFTLRQASRRSWRIGQTEPCRAVYLYYEGTMQDRALALMGRKLTAAQALEGKFSTEGLAAMAGEDANIEIALARSLVNRMECENEVRRVWTTANAETNCAGSLTSRHLVPGLRQRSLFDFLPDHSAALST